MSTTLPPIAEDASVEYARAIEGVARALPDGSVEVRTAGGWRAQHELMMEGLLRRPLRHEERVSHLNGDRGDNRMANLHLQVIGHEGRLRRLRRKVVGW